MTAVEIDVGSTNRGHLGIWHVRKEEVFPPNGIWRGFRSIHYVLRDLRLPSLLEGIHDLRSFLSLIQEFYPQINTVMLDIKEPGISSLVVNDVVNSGFKRKLVISLPFYKELMEYRRLKAGTPTEIYASISASPQPPEIIANLGFDGISIRSSFLTDAFVNSARNSSLTIAAWVVNNPSIAVRLSKLGINYLITDKPGEVKDAVKQNLQR